MFLDLLTAHVPTQSILTTSDDLKDHHDLSYKSSHCCTNCDGELTVREHRAYGVCYHCEFGSAFFQ